MPNYTCIKKPIISEKSSLLQDQGVYTFEVDIKSNKSQIKSNVESAYGVNVVHIRTLITKTALKRNARTGSWMVGKKIKKALVNTRRSNH